MELDYELLAEQKQELLKLIWKEKDSKLWGLVYLIDELQDRKEGTNV